MASEPIRAFEPSHMLQGVPLCNIADHTALLPAHKILILATDNPALLKLLLNCLLSQCQSVNVVPVDIPTTEVCTAPTTGKLHIIWLYDCTPAEIALGTGWVL